MMKNKLPVVRYRYIAEYVYKLLIRNNIATYPISIPDLISKLNNSGYNIQLDTYNSYLTFKNHMRQPQNLPPLHYKDIVKIFGSSDGATARFKGTTLNIIFYNDREPVLGRINWTQAHELGHILLKHHDIMDPIILERRGIEHINSQYDILEMEADWFARTLLCHPYVLDVNQIKTWDEIMTVCNISYRAATNREKDIFSKHYYINKPWDEYILSQIKISRHCVNCNQTILNLEYNFCPICGSNSIKWGEGEKMHYKNHETDENGRLKKCIKCDNEELVGGYCHICGSPVENYCTEAIAYYDSPDQCINQEPLLPNARFCPLCGSESTFNQRGILINWSQERRQIEEEEKQSTSSQFMNIPDGIDEEPPFPTTVFDVVDEELPFN